MMYCTSKINSVSLDRFLFSPSFPKVFSSKRRCFVLLLFLLNVLGDLWRSEQFSVNASVSHRTDEDAQGESVGGRGIFI